MPSLERITKQTSGIILEELPTRNFPTFVENLIEIGSGFPIYPMDSLQEMEGPDGLPKRKLPLISYPGSGFNGFAKISDPTGNLPGVVAIIEHSLIYSSNPVLEPRFERDSYRWVFSPYHYFVDANVTDIVKSFEMNGYPIYVSVASAFDFSHRKFQDKKPTSIQELLNNH